MKITACLLLTLLLCACRSTNPVRDKALESMVSAERGFAAASVARGIKAAFLANLADDAIVFLPKPVNGKEAYGKMPESTALLTWYPAFADISRSLDWGYTTGPYEYRGKPEEATPAGAGFYLTVWKKQPDGQWKAAIDMGNSYPVALVKEEPYQPAAEQPETQAARGSEADLLARDVQAVQPYDDETLIYRAGAYPVRYSAVAIAPAANVVYTPHGHDLSAAADMAYTYGSYRQQTSAGEEAGHYLKIWSMKDGQWKLAAHNLVPDRQ